MKNVTRSGIVIIFISGLFNFAQAAELPKTAKILPPETFLLIDIDNFSKLKTQFEKTNLNKLYKDPAMAGFIESTKAKLLEQLKKDNEEITTEIIESKLTPQGRLAAAFLYPEADDEKDEPVFVLISQWGTNKEKIKQLLDKLIKKMIEEGRHKKTEAYRGVDIITLIKENPPLEVSDDSEDQTEQNDIQTRKIERPDTMTHYSFVDDCLLLSSDMEVVKFIIAHIQGATSPAMLNESDYSSAMATTGPGHDIDLYVNMKQFFKSFSDEDEVAETLNNVGLDNLVSISSSIAVAKTEQNPFAGKVFVKIDGAKKGIFNMFDIQSMPVNIPKFIPEGSSSISFINLDIKNSYDQLATILNSFSPQYATMMYMDIVPPSEDGKPAIQLKRDIVEHLGKQIIISQSVDKPFSKSTIPQYLFAIEVTDKAALGKAFDGIYKKMATRKDAIRQFMGYTMYSFETSMNLSPQFRKGSEDEPQKSVIAFTITDSHLILGFKKTVEQVIRNLNDAQVSSVTSKKWFNAAKENIPEMAGCGSMEDVAAQMEFLWWNWKENKPEDGPLSVEMSDKPFVDYMDTTTLPQYDAVKKYFGISTSYGLSRPDGFYFEFKELVVP